MDLLAPVSRNIIAPLWALWEGSPYLRHYRQLLQTQYDPIEIIEQRQLKAVCAMTAFAYNTVPFWKKRFDAVGLGSSGVTNLPYFQKIPLLTKSDLRVQGDLLLAQG